MYRYRVDDETTNKVVSIASKNKDINKVNNLVKELEEFDKMFEYSTEVDLEPVQYEKMKDVVIDNDKIKSQAENELSEYKSSSISAIKDNTIKEIENLEKDKESSKENYKDSIESVKKYYDEVKEDASNDALKRGLSRSSIVINTMDAFNKSQLAKYNELNNELTENINAIDTEISGLKQRQEQALQAFDVTYAVKLQDKINSMTEKLLEKQEEVLKYNNEIAEKEAEYNRKYEELKNELKEANWSKEQDLMAYAGKYGVNMLNNYKKTQAYNIATKYLDSIDKAVASNELKNNESLRQLLGEDNIAKLMKKYL